MVAGVRSAHILVMERPHVALERATSVAVQEALVREFGLAASCNVTVLVEVVDREGHKSLDMMLDFDWLPPQLLDAVSDRVDFYAEHFTSLLAPPAVVLPAAA